MGKPRPCWHLHDGGRYGDGPGATRWRRDRFRRPCSLGVPANVSQGKNERPAMTKGNCFARRRRAFGTESSTVWGFPLAASLRSTLPSRYSSLSSSSTRGSFSFFDQSAARLRGSAEEARLADLANVGPIGEAAEAIRKSANELQRILVMAHAVNATTVIELEAVLRDSGILSLPPMSSKRPQTLVG